MFMVGSYIYDKEKEIEILKEVGFKLAFAGGGYKATKNSNKYAIPRYQIMGGITLDEFANLVA